MAIEMWGFSGYLVAYRAKSRVRKDFRPEEFSAPGSPETLKSALEQRSA